MFQFLIFYNIIWFMLKDEPQELNLTITKHTSTDTGVKIKLCSLNKHTI